MNFDYIIDSIGVKTTNNTSTILQLCNSISIDIPKFCYHEQLAIAGNCRMCLVEVDGIRKPVASCASPIYKKIRILTNTCLVKKAREGVLEFLLLNHPLDCPICDQGGECDLQDQSLLFGNDRGRFYEIKRSVNDKDCGPIIKTVMTRCIHCTRCIRFIDTFIGYKYLGLLGRGKTIEISNFLNRYINSEISGNLIDLCPVGALTSKPYSFIARPWELISWYTFDINDLMHINIRVDIRDTEILRILPSFNNVLKETWISDLTRFSYDSVKNNRIMHPLLKFKNTKFIRCSWEKILNLIISKCLNSNLHFIVGNTIDCETGCVLKLGLIHINNIKSINFITNSNNTINNRYDYLLDYDIYKYINIFKNIILINLNLRLTYPLLNMRLKKLKDLKLINLYSIGNSLYNRNSWTFDYSSGLKEVKKIIEGKSFLNNILLKKTKNLILINYKHSNILNTLFKIRDSLNLKNLITIGVLNNSNSNIISNELNIFNSLNKFNDWTYKFNNKYKYILYYLDCYNYLINNWAIYNVFQGSFLPSFNELEQYDLLLPSVTYYEKKGLYINIFGYCQTTKYIIFPPKNARNDWKIIYMVFRGMLQGVNKVFNFTLNYLRCYSTYYNIYNNKILCLYPGQPEHKYIRKNYINNISLLYNMSNIYYSNKYIESSLIMNRIGRLNKKLYNNFH